MHLSVKAWLDFSLRSKLNVGKRLLGVSLRST